MNKYMTATALLLLALTGCSSKSESTTTTTNTTTTVAPSLDYTQTVPSGDTTTEPTLDAMSSATVLTEDTEFGDSTYEIYYRHSENSLLLLENFMSADAMVYYALANAYVVNAEAPLDVIHQSVKESLGDRYESVRNSFNLVTLSKFLSGDTEGYLNQHSLTLDDLPNSWFDGATSAEEKLIRENILIHCNMNDLLAVNHYYSIDGIEVFIKLYQSLYDLEEYLLTESDDKKEKVANMLPLILDENTSVQASDYTMQLSNTLTVRELIDLRAEFLTYFPDEIYSNFDYITPKRIGFYNDNTAYGLSAVEWVQCEEDQTEESTTYSNLVVSHWSGDLSSKTAQLYLPKLNDEEYLVITIQEMKVDDNTYYTYLMVETCSDTWYSSAEAVELHRKNEEKIKILVSVDGTNEPVSKEEETSEEKSEETSSEDESGETSSEDESKETSSEDESEETSSEDESEETSSEEKTLEQLLSEKKDQMT